MGSVAMGKVRVEAKVTNLSDADALKTGTIGPEPVRSLTVPNALADSGAPTLASPTSVIVQLGLVQNGSKRGRTASGVADIHLYDVVQGREYAVDVM
ncbi:MAG: hypothetical protein EXS09_14370 [Gemmataceae bacterium]|nr:hypothetical protein [Gemmataceae bacterium]